MRAEIRSLILDFRAFPEAFDIAPVEGHAEAIEHRRRHEHHACKSCGHPAQAAYIGTSPMHPAAGPRWLDLCAEHARRLQIELNEMEREQDGLDAALMAYGAFRA